MTSLTVNRKSNQFFVRGLFGKFPKITPPKISFWDIAIVLLAILYTGFVSYIMHNPAVNRNNQIETLIILITAIGLGTLLLFSGAQYGYYYGRMRHYKTKAWLIYLRYWGFNLFSWPLSLIFIFRGDMGLGNWKVIFDSYELLFHATIVFSSGVLMGKILSNNSNDPDDRDIA